MARRSRYLVGALALALMVLVVAATALAKPVTPKAGKFTGATKAPSPATPGQAAFKVSKSGKKLAVEVEISMNAICQVNGGPFPVSTGVTSKMFKANEKGAPLPVKGGKFSYKGAIYGGLSTTAGKAEVSGTFKSPTKLVGSASFSWSDVSLVPGQSGGPCESGKLTFTAVHP